MRMGLRLSKRIREREVLLPTLNTKETTVDTKGLQTECNLENKDSQTTFPPDIQKEVVKEASISIALPNYTYVYEGLLKDAPHTQCGLSAQQWASQAEAKLLEQRKGCSWVKNHTMMRDRWVDQHVAQRFNSPPETISFSWKTPPEMPPCGPGCSHGDPFRFRVRNPPRRYCLPHCYYKYKGELEAHYQSCTTCKEPII
jgi:hypothetical protein